MSVRLIFLVVAFLLNICLAQANKKIDDLKNYVRIDSNDKIEDIIKKAANVTPSTRQFNWQKMEFIGFIHFGINTFHEREWGERGLDISVFNPTELNAGQWAKTAKEAGMKMLILTTKHHDGFCLWPSNYNEYNISKTPYKNGKGDVVKELSDACRKEGLKFGVYLSPWDMNENKYGTDEYNTHFKNQLTELLTNYGEISEVWFDGANGEGPNGKRQVYDWKAYYEVIRKLQPKAVIAIMGPDVRWVGTESGYGRETEWSVLPGNNLNVEQIAANSQQEKADEGFIPRDLTDEDLGSREKIKKASSLIWYPAETDVSIRPGWFYHDKEDERVKTPENLVDIYYNSVGYNSVLLLNLPPDKRGLLHENDIKSLTGMKHLLDQTFNNNLVNEATVKVKENNSKGLKSLIDNKYDTYWIGKDGIDNVEIEFNLKKTTTFDRVLLQEYILIGQRVEKFHIEWWDGKDWKNLVESSTIGYKKLLRFPAVTTDRVKMVIDQSRLNPALSSFGLYKAPPEVVFSPQTGVFTKELSITLSSEEGTTIFYTLDGTEPTNKSLLYTSPITIDNAATVTAIAIKNGKQGWPVSASYSKAEYGVTLKHNYDQKYSAGGNLGIIDGLRGSYNHGDGRWQGFEGKDFDAIIDLNSIKQIEKISTTFLQDINSWIFLPTEVEYEISQDGKNFEKVGSVKNDVSEKEEKALIKNFDVTLENAKARFIHVVAKNLGECPEWHKGKGGKAWIFADEVTVNLQ